VWAERQATATYPCTEEYTPALIKTYDVPTLLTGFLGHSAGWECLTVDFRTPFVTLDLL
jgi:hypothetical protein